MYTNFRLYKQKLYKTGIILDVYKEIIQDRYNFRYAQKTTDTIFDMQKTIQNRYNL